MRYFKIIFIILFSTLVFAENSPQSPRNMVVSEHHIASSVGIEILKAGGNAIDAAIAVGYALAVVNPCCGNIGGGGFMTLHLANGKNIFVNFREKAPHNASKDMYLDDQNNPVHKKSTDGYLAVAIPGTVMGFETVLKKYGTMSRKQVMAPAIRLAENGYILSDYDEKFLGKFTADFQNQPNVAAIFLNHGKPFKAGQLFQQKNLANTLKLIANKGADAFYNGKITNIIVNASNKNGGILSKKDFNHYQIAITNPIECTYRGYSIISAPLPSSGGVTLCEILNILENFSLNKPNSAHDIRIIVEAMRYGFIDRNAKLGDPDFVKDSTKQLLSKKYAADIAKKIIKNNKATSKSTPLHFYELTDTTHYSVIDKSGNAVAVTYTLNGFFGARVIAGDTGFFLNNEMDDFSSKAGTPNKFNLVMGDKNDIQPNKRPLSSMTPTIVMKNNRVYMVLGSPGGPRIITAVILTLLNLIDYHFNLQDAVNAPRFHFQNIPDGISIEPSAFTSTTINELSQMGYKINQQNYWGAVEAILVDPKTEILDGANDKRRPDGAAMGY